MNSLDCSTGVKEKQFWIVNWRGRLGDEYTLVPIRWNRFCLFLECSLIISPSLRRTRTMIMRLSKLAGTCGLWPPSMIKYLPSSRLVSCIVHVLSLISFITKLLSSTYQRIFFRFHDSSIFGLHWMFIKRITFQLSSLLSVGVEFLFQWDLILFLFVFVHSKIDSLSNYKIDRIRE